MWVPSHALDSLTPSYHSPTLLLTHSDLELHIRLSGPAAEVENLFWVERDNLPSYVLIHYLQPLFKYFIMNLRAGFLSLAKNVLSLYVILFFQIVASTMK